MHLGTGKCNGHMVGQHVRVPGLIDPSPEVSRLLVSRGQKDQDPPAITTFETRTVADRAAHFI